MADYNGWSNYETWAVNLWMDNDQGTQEYWRDQARELWPAAKAEPDAPLTSSETARMQLAAMLQDAHDENMPEAINNAISGTVYADLLNAALGEVDWHEIADAWLENAELEGYEPRKVVRS